LSILIFNLLIEVLTLEGFSNFLEAELDSANKIKLIVKTIKRQKLFRE